MLDMKWLVWVLAGYNLTLQCMAPCLFGTYDECVFKCHCKDVTECNAAEVTCPSGCASSILGYDWRGRACQIGNVAYRKPATIHGNVIVANGDAAKAVDGMLQPSCTNVRVARDRTAAWSVDLGGQHRIVDIIIHFSSESCCGFEGYRNHFTVTVSSTSRVSDAEVVCAKASGSSIPPPTFRIQCPVGTTGRYVNFSRLPQGVDPHGLILCEVVVIGYKPVDCSRCPVDVRCNDVTGCKLCQGSYQPDCKQACIHGFYGTNCLHECGKCAGGQTCDKLTGLCRSGCQQWWALDVCQTYIERPNAANMTPLILNTTRTSIELEWRQIPVDGALAAFYGYEIRHKVSTDKQFVSKPNTVRHRVGSTTNEITITDLMATTWYEIVVYPYREWKGQRDYGLPYKTVTAKTKCTEPENPVLTSVLTVPIIVGSKDKVDVIFQDLQKLYSGCDLLTNAWIRYKLVGHRNEQSVGQNLLAKTASFEPEYGGVYLIWITVENNAGLTSSSDVWNVTVNGPSPPTAMQESSWQKNRTKVLPVTIIIASVSGVICFFILIIAIVGCVRRRRQRLRKQDQRSHRSQWDDEDDLEVEVIDAQGRVIGGLERHPSTGDRRVNNVLSQNFELPPINDVSIEDFEDYVTYRMNTDQFVDEYSSLPQPEPDRCAAALLEENIKYNRYRKIYPYDETRVVLHKNKPTDGDFINASYITGYDSPKQYIATQGPCDTTIVDFWRMIWQEHSNRIVMVANVKEKGRILSAQYWPEAVGLPVRHGPFTLTKEDEVVTAHYTSRTITIKKDDQIRTVYHLHFTSWTDRNKPLYGAITLQTFYHKVHRFDERAEGPLVVHCSAGIGRTGVFIALDILRQQVLGDGKLNVRRCVDRLRRERMLMVQTKDQYVFLHTFLVEFIKCGSTSYDVEGFKSKYKLLREPEPELAGLSRIERQFQILCEMKDEPRGNRRKDGLLAHNKHKNRDLDLVPNDEDRPRLPGGPEHDYINAVFVDSFRTRDFYVATQMPLDATAADFWRLVHVMNAHSIVMLNQFDGSDRKSEPYWPSEQEPRQIYGPIEVKLDRTNNTNSNSCVYRRDFLIKATNVKRSEWRTVRHFQLLTWPNSSRIPPNKEDFLMLADLTEKWRRRFTRNRPGSTIVHCLTGGKQTGVYCAALTTLEKMSLERQVDAFTAVRLVTRRRVEFFQTEEEFRFLHEIAINVLERRHQLVSYGER